MGYSSGRLLGMGLIVTTLDQESLSHASGWDSIDLAKVKARKCKPNRVSQAKKRKYVRQGR